MEIAKMLIEQMNPAKYNPRKISEEALAGLRASIETFGYVEPIIVNRRTGNTVVGGHQRLKVLQSTGAEEIEVVLVDLDETREKALNVALNNKHIAGEYDAKMLSEILAELEQTFPEYDALRFDVLAEDFGIEIDDGEEYGDKDEVPEPRPESPIKRGDLIELGDNRLLCGDATVITDIEKLMGGRLADLVVTDPPYNVAYEGKTAEALTIQNDSMSDGDFYQFLLAVYTNLFLVMGDGAGIYVFHADSEGANFRMAMTDAGLKLAQCCIWVKQSMVMGRQDYHWQHEPVLYGWKPTAAHRWYTDRKQTTVWQFNRPNRNAEHPTMKPIDLVEYPIGNSSQRGDLVLDVFGGSGSTLIACQTMNRTCYTMELDPIYCQVIIDRWVKFTGKNEIKINGEQVKWEIEQ